MAQKIAGTVSVTFDGQTYTVGEGEFTANISGKKREPIPGTPYFRENLTNTMISGEIVLHPNIKTKDVTELTDATIQVSSPSGTIYLIEGAFFSGDPDVDISGGKMPIEFTAGPDAGKEV